MKIRLTKETLGLPVGTVMRGESIQTIPGAESEWHRFNGLDGILTLRARGYEAIPEPTEEDRLRDEIETLKAEIARLRSLEGHQERPQGIERHKATGNHTDEPQGATEPRYRMLEAGEVIQEGDEFTMGDDVWESTGCTGASYRPVDGGGAWKHFGHRRRITE